MTDRFLRNQSKNELVISFTIFLCGLAVSIRKQHESVGVYDAFVEDKSVAFVACQDSEMLGGGVSPEEIGVDHIDVASFVERLCDLIDQILTHDVIVKSLGSANMQSEPSHLQNALP